MIRKSDFQQGLRAPEGGGGEPGAVPETRSGAGDYAHLELLNPAMPRRAFVFLRFIPLKGNALVGAG